MYKLLVRGIVKNNCIRGIIMRSFNLKGFRAFYEKYSEEYLKKMLDSVYHALSKQFNNKVRFGDNGCKEFMGAILLFKYDKMIEEEIVFGLCKMFQNKFDSLDFSNYMDEVVQKSSITMEDWIDVYDYIESNHKWINKYKYV